MIGVVVSRADEASVHVGERLRDLGDWSERHDGSRPDAEGGGPYLAADGFELREFDGLHVELVGVADAFDDPDLVVFVSRHAGETGPLLTAHFTGNAGPAEFGGTPGELARACPNAHRRVLASLDEHAPDGYDVGMECTHHGPSAVGAPSMFVEVGSAEPQWRDADAATAVARAVLDLEGTEPDSERTVVGIGGGHYAPRFSRIVRETDWAVGHVLADWSIEAAGGLSPPVVEQAFEGSAATRAVVEGDRGSLVDAVDDRGYEVVSETWVRETAGVALDLVEAAEAAVGPVDDGLRFGEVRDADLRAEALHPDLVSAAYGVDPDATRAGIERHVVAYDTVEGGNRPTGVVCLPGDGSIEPLVSALADVLRTDADAVERDGDALVVVERAFDPGAARDRGVPEGPAFGRLSAGEPVTVDGERVTPEDVHETRTRRLAIRREPD